MNRVVIVGNLGQKPDVRQANSGTSVCNFSVATNESVKKGDQWEDHTEWHRVVVFGRVADNCGKYLDKGSKVAVEGKLRTSSWDDKDGNTRKSTEIIADKVEFLTRPENSTNSAPRQQQNNSTHGGDEIPF